MRETGAAWEGLGEKVGIKGGVARGAMRETSGWEGEEAGAREVSVERGA